MELSVELFYDRGHHHEFLSLSQELAAPGEMRQAQTYEFNFKNVEKQYESYQGINVKLRCIYMTSVVLTDIHAHSGTSSVSPVHGEWQKLTRRRISGSIRSVCHQTATTQSRWKSALRIACILSLSITNPSKSPRLLSMVLSRL